MMLAIIFSSRGDEAGAGLDPSLAILMLVSRGDDACLAMPASYFVVPGDANFARRPRET